MYIQYNDRAGVAQTVQRLDTGWTVRVSNPVEATFFASFQTDPGAYPASYAMGTGSFTGAKRPGHVVGHPPHIALRLKNEYSYTSTPPLGLRGLYYGKIYLYLYIYLYILQYNNNHLFYLMLVMSYCM
jgi:hypothetical protein